MRILIIGINYAPEIISTAVYTTGLSNFLADEGHDIEVITALPYYPNWKIFAGWRGWVVEHPKQNLKITHCPLYVPASPTGKKRILHHISFALTAMPIALRACKKTDLIFVIAPSLLSTPVAWIAAKLSKAKLWLHIQDLEIDAALATGLIKKSSILARAAKKYESWALKKYHKISTISENMIMKLIDKNVPQDKIFELRNWSDLKNISPFQGISPLRAELNITTKYAVLYSGNMAMKQGLDILPKIAEILSHRDDLTFVFCGEGPMKNHLVQQSADLKNVTFVPLQPINRLNDLMGLADIHILPQIAEASDLVLPSKLTNMLASGRPIVATSPPNTALSNEIKNAGILVSPGDYESAAQAIETLLNDKEMRDRFGKTARKKAEEGWEMGAILKRLSSEIDALLDGK